MTKLFGIGLALLAALFWSAAIVLSKHTLSEIHSNQLFVIQIISAVAVAWFVVFIRREKVGINKKSFLAYSTGLFEPFLAYLLSLYGLMFVPAGMASVVYSTETILIILLAFPLLKNKIESPGLLVVLILIAFFGSILAIHADIDDNAGKLIPQKIVGYVLIFAGVFFAALYVVISAKLIKNYKPIVLLTGQLSFCTLLAVIFVMPFTEFKSTDAATLLFAMLSGVLQYYLAFCCYLLSLKYIKIHTAGALLYLIPVFGIAFAYVFLSETVILVQLFGVLLVLTALFGLNFRYEREPATNTRI